jgi:5-methylcytosine-specific restriction protein B
MFSDDILRGIGSGGPGYNNHRWREVTFLIALAESIKERPWSERQKLFSAYDAFTDWIDTVPRFA